MTDPRSAEAMKKVGTITYVGPNGTGFTRDLLGRPDEAEESARVVLLPDPKEPA